MWQRFTERARRVVFFAQEETGKLGDNVVQTEHFLLGLTRDTDTVAAQVLEEMIGIPPETVRQTALNALQNRDVPSATKAHKSLELGITAKKVIDLAYDEARRLNNNYIGTEHFLLGMLREPDGTGGKILRDLGADVETARAIIARKQAEGLKSEPDPKTPPAPMKPAIIALKEAYLGRKEADEAPRAEPETPAVAPQIGDLGTLADTLNRAQTEFAVSLDALLRLRDAMRIKDHHAYLQMHKNGDFVMARTGIWLKLLQDARSDYYQVRQTGSINDGQIGWILPANFANAERDTRPFPPILDAGALQIPDFPALLALMPREADTELILLSGAAPIIRTMSKGVVAPPEPLPVLSADAVRGLLLPLLSDLSDTERNTVFAGKSLSFAYTAPDGTPFSISVHPSPHLAFVVRYESGEADEGANTPETVS